MRSASGLTLDTSADFDSFINQAVLIAQKVQAGLVGVDVAPEEPKAARPDGAGPSKKDKKAAAKAAGGKRGAASQGGARAAPGAWAKEGDNRQGENTTELAAAAEKLRAGDREFLLSKAHLNGRDLAVALGCCPDCGFNPSAGSTLYPHHCYPSRYEGRVAALKRCAERGVGFAKRVGA